MPQKNQDRLPPLRFTNAFPMLATIVKSVAGIAKLSELNGEGKKLDADKSSEVIKRFGEKYREYVKAQKASKLDDVTDDVVTGLVAKAHDRIVSNVGFVAGKPIEYDKPAEIPADAGRLVEFLTLPEGSRSARKSIADAFADASLEW